jgi:OOP family OmpA-OmpF porin
MQEHPEIRITVTGHTDNVGSLHFNEALSLRRASAVGAYLTQPGRLDRSRIELRGLGSATPFASNDTEEGRRMNRIVRFTILTL